MRRKAPIGRRAPQLAADGPPVAQQPVEAADVERHQNPVRLDPRGELPRDSRQRIGCRRRMPCGGRSRRGRKKETGEHHRLRGTDESNRIRHGVVSGQRARLRLASTSKPRNKRARR